MYYTYFSYESKLNGRGYHKIDPNKNPNLDGYFGSFRDKTFNPDKKIVLKIFLNKEEALKHEIYLHAKYNVEKNPYFANKVNQSNLNFTPPIIPWNKNINLPQEYTEKRIKTMRDRYGENIFTEIMKKSWRTIKKSKTKEEIIEMTKPGRDAAIKKGPWNKGKKGLQKAWNKGMTGEKFSEAAKKGHITRKKRKYGNQQPSTE